MATLQVRLFGKFSISYDGRAVDERSTHKARELFAYLLLHRDRPHPRETLAGTLWGDSTTAQSKKYLRQALWQLQSVLRGRHGASRPLLLVSSSWVQIHPRADLWTDVEAVEGACARAQGIPIENLDGGTLSALRSAADLYRADLLEGWYQDWCAYERERLRTMYLAMLDKLTGYCELHALVDAGVRYATLSLRYDRARELAHQQLMRLYCLGEDRAAALRQYDRCLAALQEDLGVQPSATTTGLYEQIKATNISSAFRRTPGLPSVGAPEIATLSAVLGRLRQLDADLVSLDQRVRNEITAVENVLGSRRSVVGARQPAVRALGTVRRAVPAKPAVQT